MWGPVGVGVLCVVHGRGGGGVARWGRDHECWAGTRFDSRLRPLLCLLPRVRPARPPAVAAPPHRCRHQQILSKKVSPKAFAVAPEGAAGGKRGESSGDIGIEGTAIEEPEEVRGV